MQYVCRPHKLYVSELEHSFTYLSIRTGPREKIVRPINLSIYL